MKLGVGNSQPQNLSENSGCVIESLGKCSANLWVFSFCVEASYSMPFGKLCHAHLSTVFSSYSVLRLPLLLTSRQAQAIDGGQVRYPPQVGPIPAARRVRPVGCDARHLQGLYGHDALPSL